MELKRLFIFVLLAGLLVVSHARPSFEEEREKRDEGELETEMFAEEEEEDEPDTEDGGESASGEEPATPPPAAPAPGAQPPAGGAPQPPTGGAPQPPSQVSPPVNPIVNGVNQACTAFQACAAQGDPALCLTNMLTTLSSLLGGGGGGCQQPCQGGAAPMPYPQPQPYPYPSEQIIVDPVGCGGVGYPCKDKASGKKHHEKEHKSHH